LIATGIPILIKVNPSGPVCQRGTSSALERKLQKVYYELETIVNQRIDENIQDSYTNKIFRKGINKIAQKVGEEAVELIIESKDENIDLFRNEAADLLYHFLILLKAKKLSFSDIEEILLSRHKSVNLQIQCPCHSCKHYS
jgi:phosphoribosyl-ATP pyrophosphohydrolase/phosphoribosyl-AMP cyclohydrolase